MRNAPRFPQGKVVTSIPKIVRQYDISPESKVKLQWAHRQVQGAMTIGDHEYVSITVTNFDAPPQTMQHWLKRACREMFHDGKHLSFKYRGTRKNGTMFFQLVDGPSPRHWRKESKRNLVDMVSFQD